VARNTDQSNCDRWPVGKVIFPTILVEFHRPSDDKCDTDATKPHPIGRISRTRDCHLCILPESIPVLGVNDCNRLVV
jgi:hypothetical protein